MQWPGRRSRRVGSSTGHHNRRCPGTICDTANRGPPSVRRYKVRMNVRTVRELVAVAVVDDPIADVSLHPGTRHLDDTAIMYCHGELLEDTSWYLCSLEKSRRIAFTQELVEGLRTDKRHRNRGRGRMRRSSNPGQYKRKVSRIFSQNGNGFIAIAFNRSSNPRALRRICECKLGAVTSHTSVLHNKFTGTAGRCWKRPNCAPTPKSKPHPFLSTGDL